MFIRIGIKITYYIPNMVIKIIQKMAFKRFSNEFTVEGFTCFFVFQILHDYDYSFNCDCMTDSKNIYEVYYCCKKILEPGIFELIGF